MSETEILKSMMCCKSCTSNTLIILHLSPIIHCGIVIDIEDVDISINARNTSYWLWYTGRMLKEFQFQFYWSSIYPTGARKIMKDAALWEEKIVFLSLKQKECSQNPVPSWIENYSFCTFQCQDRILSPCPINSHKAVHTEKRFSSIRKLSDISLILFNI